MIAQWPDVMNFSIARVESCSGSLFSVTLSQFPNFGCLLQYAFIIRLDTQMGGQYPEPIRQGAGYCARTKTSTVAMTCNYIIQLFRSKPSRVACSRSCGSTKLQARLFVDASRLTTNNSSSLIGQDTDQIVPDWSGFNAQILKERILQSAL